MSKFIVLDDSKSFLAAFETEAQAKQYAVNNSDIAGFINDEKIIGDLDYDTAAIREKYLQTPEYSPRETPIITGPPSVRKTEARVKALTAAEAIAEIKASQAIQVSDIITSLIAYEGYLEMDKPHKYVIETLVELGYNVELTASGITVKVEAEIE